MKAYAEDAILGRGLQGDLVGAESLAEIEAAVLEGDLALAFHLAQDGSWRVVELTLWLPPRSGGWSGSG